MVLRQLFMTMSALFIVLTMALTVSMSLPYFVGESNYVSFFGERDPTANRYWPALLHIFGGIVALLLGPSQFWRKLREKSPRSHRTLGRFYVVAVLLSSGAALGIAPYTLGGAVNGIGFGLLAILWSSTTMIAIWHVRSGRIHAHRFWMILSYALALSGISLRLQLGIFVGLIGLPFEIAYAIVPWSSWIPNLLVVLIVALPAHLMER